MNERIKELSDQAYDYARAKNSIYSPQLLRDYTERFAELIVKECLLKANGAKIRGETIDELIERIKDDFGVE